MRMTTTVCSAPLQYKPPSKQCPPKVEPYIESAPPSTRTSSANFSASLTMRSTSSLASVLAPVILMSCFLPVPLSARPRACSTRSEHKLFREAWHQNHEGQPSDQSLNTEEGATSGYTLTHIGNAHACGDLGTEKKRRVSWRLTPHHSTGHRKLQAHDACGTSMM